jgi:hypothetical protein
MATTILVGGQWGDEVKGKIIDVRDKLVKINGCGGYKFGVKLSIVSDGARREETIFLQ